MSDNVNSLFQQATAKTPIRGVHLDLKGMPPTPKRLLEQLKIFRAGRYNMLLVEWEDMFPWTVDERFRCSTAYTSDDVRRFASAAAEQGLEIIPLVQCLGHMETVLGIADYIPMREVPDRADVLHPLARGASELICRMIDDVTALLPNLRYFHIGGDEAWTFGQHPASAEYIQRHGKAGLYMHHVQPILDRLKQQSIRPILWHDMMIEWPPEALRKLGADADLMVWGYGQTPDECNHHYATRHIQHFHDAGVPLWGATAYKGADGMTSDLPNLARRRHNARGWMDVAGRFNFKGVVATAWSRYSTDVPQCDPAEGALDSLLLVGAILHDGDAPLERREACLKVLEQLGERDRFLKTCDALRRMADLRADTWLRVEHMRELVALSKLDGKRAVEFAIDKRRKQTVAALEQLKGIEQTLRESMKGTTDSRWTEEYLDVRRNAIETEHRSFA